MPYKGSEQCQGDGDSPHGNSKAVHIKNRITASVEHAVDRNGVHTSSDHINTHDNHHSGKILLRLRRQDDHPYDQRSQCQYEGCRGKSDYPRDVFELDPERFAFFQVAGAQLVADHDAGGGADAVAGTADEVADDGCHGIGGSGISPKMPDDGGVGGEAYAPQKTAAQKGIAAQTGFHW